MVMPGGAGAQGRPPAARRSPPAPRLPPVVPVSGPLSIRVAYPSAGQLVLAEDSTFLFGSIGNGRATLAVNGLPVEVAPNGAFLAWVPMPAAEAVNGRAVTARFQLVARLGTDSTARELVVRVPERLVNPDSGLWLDTASISPAGMMWVEPGEMLRFSVTASPGAIVQLELPGHGPQLLAADTSRRLMYGPFDRNVTRTPLTETRYVGWFPASQIGFDASSPTDPHTPGIAWDSSRSARIAISNDHATLRVPVPLRVALVDPIHPPVVLLDDDTARAGNTDGAVAATPVPQGTFTWFFPNGTPVRVSGRIGQQLRVRLSRDLDVWVPMGTVAATLPDGSPPPRATLRLVRLYPDSMKVAARFALSQRVPFAITEDADRLVVRLYSTRMDLDWVQYGSTDPFVDRVTWQQEPREEGVVTLELARPVFGYRSRWEGNDLIVEIRRPPVIDARRPLRGRTIAVDPGHPPQGATGPTGLEEKEANLAVARVLERLLRAAGATVIMTRDADTAVGLYERTNLAERKEADILVSIHNNAFPDGVNPWVNNGTSTYYYQPRSAHLARLVQDALVRRMGLRNLGFGRGDLALVRPTWMPAILTEGAFLMIPEQENALRTPSFQERYARGVMEGIEAYLRELAGGRAAGR